MSPGSLERRLKMSSLETTVGFWIMLCLEGESLILGFLLHSRLLHYSLLLFSLETSMDMICLAKQQWTEDNERKDQESHLESGSRVCFLES